MQVVQGNAAESESLKKEKAQCELNPKGWISIRLLGFFQYDLLVDCVHPRGIKRLSDFIYTSLAGRSANLTSAFNSIINRFICRRWIPPRITLDALGHSEIECYASPQQ
jgi:hypothetical protein